MIKTNVKWESLLPKQDEFTFKSLEESILKEGIRDAIVLWNDTIIDGHHRYKIALKHTLPFKTIVMDFEDDDQCELWIRKNQSIRRNFTKEQFDYNIGRIYAIEKKAHGTNQYSGGVANFATPKNQGTKFVHPLKREQIPTVDQYNGGSTKFVLPLKREQIADRFNISAQNVVNNEKFAQGVDKLSPELKQDVLNGISNINKGYIQTIAKAEPTFVATTEQEIIAKAKEIKEQKAEAYKQKMEDRIETKTKEIPLSIEEQVIFDKLNNGETVVINMDVHFHVLKYAKEKGIYQQIDRWSEWGNPFYLDADGNRDEVCDGYIEYLKHKRSLHPKIPALKGKVLGCHCYPLRCHGEHLKTLADE